MSKKLSRRRFLNRSALGGAALLTTHAVQADSTTDAAAGAPPVPYQPTTTQIVDAYARAKDYDEQRRLPLYGANLVPHWFGAADSHFWYRNDGARGKRDFILVEATEGTKAPAFDHARLAQGLAKATGKPVDAARLPFEAIDYSTDLKSVRFTVQNETFTCNLTTYGCAKSEGLPVVAAPPTPPGPQRGGRRSRAALPDVPGKWTAFFKDNNVWVRETAGGKETQLTTTGTTDKPFDKNELRWSPDKETLAAYRVTPVVTKPVYLIESSPKEGFRGVLHQHEYLQPGEPMDAYELWLLRPGANTAVTVEVEPFTFQGTPNLHWRDGKGEKVVFAVPDRGHQHYRVLEATAATGKTRAIVDEKVADPAKSFINTSNVYLDYTPAIDQCLYASEKDGWRHLYHYDVETGKETQITRGSWVVRDVDRIDANEKQIWFQASGINAGEDPYNRHFYRVGFDGTGLTALTGGNGGHTIQYSPNRVYLIDTCSRPDLPPVHTLRRVSDGGLIGPLEKTDISALTVAGWKAPEVFSAKGRDGQTDIWGIVFRPTHFDPTERYPIIENIYAGPQDSFVRKTFAVRDGMQALAELGFIVVQCDGMGTRNRSKAFHDVCWRNLKDAGFPDRIAWMRALSAKYPQCDTSRVGIYGTSAGGQNSTGGVLFHPDFYKVAVSSCGCHDNRIDKQWWNEQWMGYPLGPWYEDCSNITHAAKLKGKLMLMAGELDSNVPPESTIRLTDALIKADKDYELIVLPGLNHTSGGTYGERRRRDFFVRHLLGVEPPDRNKVVPTPPAKPVTLAPHPPTDTYLANADAGADTTVTFRNRTGDTVQLFWLQGDGKRTAYGTIPKGESRTLHTYAGHVWVVVGADGRDIALFAGETRPGVAEIGAAK